MLDCSMQITGNYILKPSIYSKTLKDQPINFRGAQIQNLAFRTHSNDHKKTFLGWLGLYV